MGSNAFFDLESQHAVDAVAMPSLILVIFPTTSWVVEHLPPCHPIAGIPMDTTSMLLTWLAGTDPAALPQKYREERRAST